mgnify:CR=1 FL=1
MDTSKIWLISDTHFYHKKIIDFIKDDGKEYARVDVAYFVHEGKKVIKTMEKFTLRKDSDGKWKILFWEIGKVSDMEG